MSFDKIQGQNCLLHAQNIVCLRDDQALFKSVSFMLEVGEVLQVFGQNGAGKTTLLRTLAGLFRQFEGDFFWRGKPLSHGWHLFHPEKIFLGHDLALKLSATPIENLIWWQAISGHCVNQQQEAADFYPQIKAVLHDVGLQYFEATPCQELSAGQKRRVSLARLFLAQVPLWILDEPFTNLDKKGVQLIENALNRHIKAGGCVIFSSHQSLDSITAKKLELIPVAY